MHYGVSPHKHLPKVLTQTGMSNETSMQQVLVVSSMQLKRLQFQTYSFLQTLQQCNLLVFGLSDIRSRKRPVCDLVPVDSSQTLQVPKAEKLQ